MDCSDDGAVAPVSPSTIKLKNQMDCDDEKKPNGVSNCEDVEMNGDSDDRGRPSDESDDDDNRSRPIDKSDDDDRSRPIDKSDDDDRSRPIDKSDDDDDKCRPIDKSDDDDNDSRPIDKSDDDDNDRSRPIDKSDDDDNDRSRPIDKSDDDDDRSRPSDKSDDDRSRPSDKSDDDDDKSRQSDKSDDDDESNLEQSSNKTNGVKSNDAVIEALMTAATTVAPTSECNDGDSSDAGSADNSNNRRESLKNDEKDRNRQSKDADTNKDSENRDTYSTDEATDLKLDVTADDSFSEDEETVAMDVLEDEEDEKKSRKSNTRESGNFNSRKTVSIQKKLEPSKVTVIELGKSTSSVFKSKKTNDVTVYKNSSVTVTKNIPKMLLPSRTLSSSSSHNNSSKSRHQNGLQIDVVSVNSNENRPSIEVIDEKDNYDKLSWESDLLFPFFRPGRYVPPNPNETMSLSMCNERLVECPSKTVPFLLRYPPNVDLDNYQPVEKKTGPVDISMFKTISVLDQSYFKSSLGIFFIEIGQRLVSEWVQKDLVRSRKRKIEKDGKTEASVKSFEAMANMYQELKNINNIFHFPLIKCSLCDFKTESRIVLKNHYQTPHTYPGSPDYHCTFCKFKCSLRNVRGIAVHMQEAHQTKPILRQPTMNHECPLCIYGTDKKSRMTGHIGKCIKNFRLPTNLSPTLEYSYPSKSFPPSWMQGQSLLRAASNAKNVTRPLPVQQRGIPASGYKPIQPMTKARPLLAGGQTMNSGIQFDRMSPGHNLPPSVMVTKHTTNKNQPAFVSNSRNFGQSTSGMTMNQASFSLLQKLGNQNKVSPVTILKSNQLQQNSLQITQKQFSLNSAQKPSITLTPVNSLPEMDVKKTTKATSNGLQSVTVPFKGGKGSHTFVICEICDGYIRDLEQLRAHMQWMHKVKIHPKMIYNRPPLNCQKCQFRFFTDQGLERHLLGIHGLVTSNMQELANKGLDSGRCSACGKTFQTKLLLHIAKLHKVLLKPAHLSYKCTVCAATFNLYKLFESHVYSEHTVQANKERQAAAARAAAAKQAMPIAYRPGPACSKRRAIANGANDLKPRPVSVPQCPKCDRSFSDIEKHWKEKHQKPFSVKLCRIEQCHKCLSEFDGFVVIHTDYFEDSDEDQLTA